MHCDGKILHILLVNVLLHVTLGKQCPGSATTVGDGSCDEENNNADCNYDGGDCCQCTCHGYHEYACGYRGFDCRDPTSPNVFSDCERAPVVSAPCLSDDIIEFDVWDTPSAVTLAKEVNSSGGAFDVTWRGYVEVHRGIYISNGTILNITGSCPEATMDGKGNTRLFTVEGATLFLNNIIILNGSAMAGGAIAAVESSLYLDQTSFISNTAVGDGGAIYLVSHNNVAFRGPTRFAHNTASSRGGALHVGLGSNVTWPGNILNAGTTVSWTEGGIDLDEGFAFHGEHETMFHGNQALSGGAVFISDNSIVSWDANMLFSANNATLSGGALFVSSGSGASWFANTSFITNQADGDGGAIYVTHGSHQTGSPFLLVNGCTIFLENHCKGSGGGLAVVTESTIILEATNIVFKEDSAEALGGAISSSGLGRGPHFRSVRFLMNKADMGGAASLVSSGTAVRGDEDVHRISGLPTFDRCLLQGNEASSDGSALVASTGSRVIWSTYFVNNSADRGGAIYLASTGYLWNCSLIENTSNEDGGYAVYRPYLFSFDISRSNFFRNAPNCGFGGDLHFQAPPTDSQWETIPWNVGFYGCSTACNNCSYDAIGFYRHTPDHSYSQGGKWTIEGLSIGPGYWRPANWSTEIEDPYIYPGYWRPANWSTEIFKCYNREACPGGTGAGGYCEQGYKGLVCSQCENGYMGTSDFRCINCSGTSTGTVVVVVGSILAVIAVSILAFCMISRNGIPGNYPEGRLPETSATWRRPLQSFKIVIVAWQILTQFAHAVDVVYPGIYGDLLNVIEFFNFDVSWILSTGCVVDLGFRGRLIMSTVGPIAFFGFLATTCGIGMRRHRGLEGAVSTIRRKHLSVVIFFTSLMYSPISSILFQTFVFDKVGGECFLRADSRIECKSPESLQLRKLAIPMMVLYTLGIPVFYALVLFWNRKVLMDKTAREADLLAKSTSILWKLYRPECYYFELIECLRRVFFAAILTFIYPNSVSQVTVGLMFGLVFLIVSEALSPYASKLDAWASRMGHVVVCTSMVWSILVKFKSVYGTPEEERDSKYMFTCILLASHGLMVAAVLVETCMITCQLVRAEKVRECSKPIARRRRKIAPHPAGLKVLGDAAYFTGGRRPPIQFKSTWDDMEACCTTRIDRQ